MKALTETIRAFLLKPFFKNFGFNVPFYSVMCLCV